MSRLPNGLGVIVGAIVGVLVSMSALGFNLEEKAESRRRRKGETGRGKEGEGRRKNRGPISPNPRQN